MGKFITKVTKNNLFKSSFVLHMQAATGINWKPTAGCETFTLTRMGHLNLGMSDVHSCWPTGTPLMEITLQRNLAVLYAAPCWYLVQRILLKTKQVIETEQSQGFQADVLMPGRNKGQLFCCSAEDFRVVGTTRFKEK